MERAAVDTAIFAAYSQSTGERVHCANVNCVGSLYKNIPDDFFAWGADQASFVEDSSDS
jgi:hypothetical protein